MKSKLKYSVLAIFLAGSSSMVMAADNAEIKITGKIGAPTCDVSLGSAGIDFGRIAVSSLSKTTDTYLPVKTLAGGVKVTCGANTSISLTFKDNRASSAGGNTTDLNSTTHSGIVGYMDAYGGAGLGFDSANHKIGGYLPIATSPTIDGVASAFVSKSTYATLSDNGASAKVVESLANGVALAPDYTFGFTNDVAGKVFAFDYKVAAAIAPTNNLDMTKPITLDGSIAVQVNYL